LKNPGLRTGSGRLFLDLQIFCFGDCWMFFELWGLESSEIFG
jgi:hypothetical protein